MPYNDIRNVLVFRIITTIVENKEITSPFLKVGRFVYFLNCLNSLMGHLNATKCKLSKLKPGCASQFADVHLCLYNIFGMMRQNRLGA